MVGPLTNIEVIARGREIRVLKRLNEKYGKGTWRKLKADTDVVLPDGTSVALRYTIMKLTALDVGVLRSNGIWNEEGKAVPPLRF